MGAPTTYPDGSVLVSSALTLADVNAIWQPLVLQMLGLADSATDAPVRIEYPTQGAPFQNAAEDVVYLSAMVKDDPYDKIRDEYNWIPEGFGQGQAGKQPFGGTTDDPTISIQTNFTRVWNMRFCFYGPNSLDRARILRSGLYQPIFTNALAISQLFPVSEFKQPIRAPELLNAQWYERVDFDFDVYEFVTETITRQTVESVEVVVLDPSGEIADITVDAADE